MKIILAACVLIILAAQRIAITQQQPSNTKHSMVYVVMINSPEEEEKAGILINSIRTYGGDYSGAPVIIVVSDSTKTKGTSLQGKAQDVVVLNMNEKLRSFPFSDKVYACAQIEEMVEGKTEWLVWLNPDVLFFAPPSEIAENKDAWAALRPVHIQNIGSGAEAPINEYWKRVYQAAELDTNKIWTVESYVDNKKVRGYFNSGFMAFNPSKGILRTWQKNFEKLLSDSSNYNFYNSDKINALFCHQALLSAVIMTAGKDKINMLPPTYGYPATLQNYGEFPNKKHSLSELKTVICEEYINLKNLKITEPYKSWIESNIKIK